MHHPLIATVVLGLVLAFILGAIAQRLRFSPLVGYLLAGVLVGPHTPGLFADQAIAGELAEIGVILLMFGVGLHFSLGSLMSVASIAVPGAIVQIAVATLLGMALAHYLGWSIGAGIIFGLALSVASTVVLLRALQERRLVDTTRGRIAIGWLVVEDLVMVLALVLIPPLVAALPSGMPTTSVWRDPKVIYALTLTLGQVAAFVALMLIVGRRVIPWILHYVAHTGSRELFRLAVLAIALGVAYGATELFGISFALGAFFAGMMLHESPLSQRAAEESLPLRDAFAVLFFVSVGMLFDPKILIREPLLVAATLFIIVFGKSIAAFLIVRIFGHPTRTALTIAASLAQIGEFSFILASLGVALAILPPQGRDLILAGALLSILVNPFLFVALDRTFARQKSLGTLKEAGAIEGSASDGSELPQSKLSGHTILIGYGRVGRVVGEGLLEQGRPLLVIEERAEALDQLKAGQTETIVANAVQGEVLNAANIGSAHWLVVAIPDGFEAGQIVQQARTLNPRLEIIARAHSDAEVEYLMSVGANFTILGEHEIALAMLDRIRRARNDGTAKPA